MLELIGGATLLVALYIFFLASRYKRCPADKILVVFGKTVDGSRPQIYPGGSVFVWPVLQDFAYLDRTPLKVATKVRDAPDKDRNLVSMAGEFIVAIGDTEVLMKTAANRLLNQRPDQISDLCEKIIKGQLRLVVSGLASVEINDRERLIKSIYVSVNEQLNTIGLQLLNADLNEVQVDPGNTASHPRRASTEEQGVQPSSLEIELRPDQVDVLLKGIAVNLHLPEIGHSIRISQSSATN